MKKKFRSSAVRKWKVESGKWKVSNALRANVNKLAFSLVELMISLIVISIVTAAFAPVLTKKLKTSDQSIGTATVTSITSSAVCNSVAKGCSECENDKCLAADFDKGYFLNASNVPQMCNTAIAGCQKCNNDSRCEQCEEAYTASDSGCTPCLSGCTACVDGRYLDGSGNCKTCSSAIKHCDVCANSSTCTTCASGYQISQSNKCFKYECDDIICIYTTAADTKLSIYRHYLGDTNGPVIPPEITVCATQASCTLGAKGTCWQDKSTWHLYPTSNRSWCSSSSISDYSGCQRTVCNYKTTTYAAIPSYAAQGWRVPTKADIDKITDIKFTENSSFVDPFCTGHESSSGVVVPRCPLNLDNELGQSIWAGAPHPGNCYGAWGYYCNPQHIWGQGEHHSYSFMRSIFTYGNGNVNQSSLYGAAGDSMAAGIILIKD